MKHRHQSERFRRRPVDASGHRAAMEFDDFRRNPAEDQGNFGSREAAIPDAVTDPVLAELWDNSEDEVYDRDIAASTSSGIADRKRNGNERCYRETIMAIAADLPAEQADAASVSAGIRAFARFLSGVRTVESVKKVVSSTDGVNLQVWVLMREDIAEDFDRVFDFEYDLRRAVGPVPIDVRVVPLSEVDEAKLPPTETILERA